MAFASIQHDDITFNGVSFAGGVISFINKDWNKRIIPLPMIMKVKEQESDAIVQISIQEFVNLSQVFHLVGDNEPSSLKITRNLMLIARDEQSILNENNIDDDDDIDGIDEFEDLHDKYFNQGCISHLLNLVVSYCVGLKTSKRKNGPTQHRHIPPADKETSILVDKIIEINKLALTYDCSNDIRNAASLKKAKIYRPQLPNETRWSGIYLSLKAYLKMKSIWCIVPKLNNIIKTIDENHVNELFSFLHIIYETSKATQYRNIPLSSWYGPLVAALLNRFGINITLKGLKTTYQEIYDIKNNKIKENFSWNESLISFILDFMEEKMISVDMMSNPGKKLFHQLAIHLAFRFLPMDSACKVPDIYIMSTLAHPYSKSYIKIVLGLECTIKIQEEYLQKSLKRFLPNHKIKKSLDIHDIDGVMEPLLIDEIEQESNIMHYIKYIPDLVDWNRIPSLKEIIKVIPKADPLLFWKNNTLFPEIKSLNMILMATDISSAVTEGFFSTLKETITSRRQKLSPQLISKAVALRYIFNQAKHQKISETLDNESDDDVSEE